MASPALLVGSSSPNVRRPTSRRVLWSALVAALLTTTTSCDEPCCAADDDCVDGAGCFEGTCALRCEADSMCGEGEICATTDEGGVCRERDAALGLERCAVTPVSSDDDDDDDDGAG